MPHAGVKHLTEADRQRVRTLYFDAGLSPKQIFKITGFTLGQIKRARDKLHVGKRTGRPKLIRPADDGKEAARAKFKAGKNEVSICLSSLQCSYLVGFLLALCLGINNFSM